MNNIFDKLKQELYETFRYAEEHEGCNALADAIQHEYDKLCPRPEEFETAQWYAIDSDGQSAYFMDKPDYMCNEFWIMQEDMMFGDKVTIPLGIDWRLCCWSIEDAKRIHGGGDD